MKARTTLVALVPLLIAAALAAGCGGASGVARSSDRGGGGGAAATSLYQVSEDAAYGGGAAGYASADDDSPGDDSPAMEPSVGSDSGDDGESVAVAPAAAPPMYAQAARRASASGAATDPAGEQAQATASDAVDTSGPLLIYTATFHLAVYEVRESQEQIVLAAREAGGFVFAQSDDRVVVRVPSARFRTVLEAVEQAGDVEHRDVQAQDVSEEFHDVEIRIRNLEVMRQRVEALLAQARTVEDALAVERQLQRITEELERMRGRQRFLADRIALSTITVLFRPRPRELVGQPEIFQLPFAWLDQLGLSSLLDLR